MVGLHFRKIRFIIAYLPEEKIEENGTLSVKFMQFFYSDARWNADMCKMGYCYCGEAHAIMISLGQSDCFLLKDERKDKCR